MDSLVLHIILCVVAPSVTSRVRPSDPVILGTMVDLICEATAGSTPISFSWMNAAGSSLSPNDTDGTVSVTISSTEDYGTYTCTASNGAGTDTSDVKVTQASKTVKYGTLSIAIVPVHMLINFGWYWMY